jgi:uridine phosphorylase
MGEVYHLGLNKKKIKNATYAILTGDPGRVPNIAERFSNNHEEIAFNREFRTFLVEYSKVPIVIISTGIGGSSASIVMDELASIGVKTLIRIGTSGSIQDYIKAGNVVITTGSVRLDGASLHYAPIEYPATANYEVINALVNAAKATNVKFHTGITVSTATFYPGQERYDSFLGYVIKSLQGSKEEWRKLNVLNYEMESATILTLANVFGLRAGCVTGIVAEREMSEKITRKALMQGEENSIIVGVGAIKNLVTLQRNN